jgi:hypothetical protein
MMKQLGKQAGSRTGGASSNLRGGGRGARPWGTRCGALTRVRIEKVPHARRLGKRLLNGLPSPNATEQGIRPRCPAYRCRVPIGGRARLGARNRAGWGARAPDTIQRAGWGARAADTKQRPSLVPGEGPSGISNARAQSMMLSNSLGWKSWYGMCTKRAIMRPGTSVLASTSMTATSVTATSVTLSSMTWMNEFERDTTAPGYAASR